MLAAAIAQIPARMGSRLLVRVDGAGASHELIRHLLSLGFAAAEGAVHLGLDGQIKPGCPNLFR